MSKIEELIKKLCPNGVEYKKLGELIIIEKGKQLNKTLLSSNGIYPVINGGIMPSGYWNKYNYTENLITISQGGASAGYVNFIDTKFWAGAHCYVIVKVDSKINYRYVYHFLKSKENELQNSQVGAGIPSVSLKDINNLCIAVPPLEVQCEIVHILDDFTLLSAELSAELKARQKQYEYYLYKLISDSKKITKNKLYELTIWDKKFNAVENYMQPNVKKYPTLLAVDLFNLERENGNVFLLSTGGQRGWTTEEVAGDNISEGEVVTIPWGKSRPVQEVMKYYCGKFVTGDNRIATSNDIKKLNNKYLFYWMQTQSERIDKFYRGSGIQHPNMRNVLTLEIELPSIDEQKRIVSILDKFEKLCNDISEGLPAEIEARQKQYEYYRDKLLTFKELKVNE